MKRTPHPLTPLLGTLAASVLLMSPALAQDVDPDADSLPLPEIPLEAPMSAPAAPVSPAAAPPAQPCGEAAPAPVAMAQATPRTAPPTTPPAAPAGQPQQVKVGDTTIYGDTLENDPATGLYIFTGNAKAVRGTDEIHADKLIYNPMTAEFTAEGNVVIFQEGREIHSTRATYKFTDSTGEIADVREKYGPYYIKSNTVKLHEGPVYEALRATFTTCDKEHPHYDFYARQIEIYPGKELIARHMGIDVFGFRVATIPKYRKSLAPNDDDNRSLYPTIGYNHNTGPYVRKEFTLIREAPVWLNADVQINTFIEPSGGLLASTGGTGQFRASAYYRDEAENQRVRFLRVSRLPEIGWVWTPGERAQPGEFLPHQVGSIHSPRGLAVTGKWRFAAEASAGYFLQHHGDDVVDEDSESKAGGRVKFQAQAVKPRLDLGPIRLNDLRLMVRETLYDTGENFTVLGTGIGKRVRFRNLYLSVLRLDQFTDGTTPFLFDDVELSQEWRPRLEYITPGFSFTYAARLRGNNGQLYDQMFSVSKLFHCIEPRLTFRTRRSEIFLEIRIPGLSGYGRSRPGQARSVGSDDSDGTPE